jgi:hypothetical protein
MSCTITDTRESRKLFLAWLKEGIEFFKGDNNNPEKEQYIQRKYGLSHQKKVWDSIMDTIHASMFTDKEVTTNFINEIITSMCGISNYSSADSLASPIFIPVSFLKLEISCLVLDMMATHRAYFPTSGKTLLQQWYGTKTVYEKFLETKLRFLPKNKDAIWNIAMGTWSVLSDSAYWTRKSPIQEIEQRGKQCLEIFMAMKNEPRPREPVLLTRLPNSFITTIMTSYGEMLESALSFPASVTHLDALGRILSLSKDMDAFLNIKRPLWLDESLYSWVSPLRLRCMNHFVDMNDEIQKTHTKKDGNVDWGIFR